MTSKTLQAHDTSDLVSEQPARKLASRIVVVEALFVAAFALLLILTEFVLSADSVSAITSRCEQIFTGASAIFFALAGATIMGVGLTGKGPVGSMLVRALETILDDMGLSKWSRSKMASPAPATPAPSAPILGPSVQAPPPTGHIETLSRIRDKAQTALSGQVPEELGGIFKDIWFAAEVELENVENKTQH